MGGSIATVAAVVALVAGVALIDHGRGTADGAGSAVAATADTDGASAGGPNVPEDALGGASLTDCLGEIGTGPPPTTEFPGLDEQGVEEIAGRVERIRELRFSAAVDATFLSDAALDRRIDELSREEGTKAATARQGAALQLLGAIPPDADLFELTTDALTSQVVGLYAPETKELLVARAGSAGTVEEITLSHELEHALADDALGLPLPAGTTAGNSDRVLATQALIEGDATLTMQLYALRYVSISDQLGLSDDPSLEGSGGLGELPDFLRRQLLFPYEAGLQFVCNRYKKGGWSAVDDAYADPPASTAQLLGLREADPVDPPAPGSLSSPWKQVLRDQLGAAALAWLFAAPGGDPDEALPDPRDAIAGWAGDRIVLWERGDGGPGNSALALSIVDEGGTLCGATIAWYAAAFPGEELGRDGATTTFEGDGRAAAISCEGESIKVGIAPDAALAATLAGSA